MILDEIVQHGAYFLPSNYSDELLVEIEELEREGLIVRVDRIPHHRKTINPSYTFVTNDDRGHTLALDHALFTLVF
jgi:hypothetical protein